MQRSKDEGDNRENRSHRRQWPHRIKARYQASPARSRSICSVTNSGVNTLTGEGLAAALKGSSVAVDVSNSTSWEDTAVMKFFETSTRNLLAYEAAAGVGHHVALSVVGSERLLQSGYFRAKIAQENLIKGSSIPYSIVRATQFFEFVKGIADLSTAGNTVRLPPALIQPMAADNVASAVCRIAMGSPLNGTLEVGGPEQFPLYELVRRGLAVRKDPREVVADPHARYYGIELGESTLVPGTYARSEKRVSKRGSATRQVKSLMRFCSLQ